MDIGCARVSTAERVLSAQLDALKVLGLDENNTHVSLGLTESGRARAGPEEARAALRAGQR